MSESTTKTDHFDCIVVGSGHAGSCAALSLIDSGVPPSHILLIDKCPPEWAGGNGYFTAGAHRTAHHGVSDLLPIVQNPPSDPATIDIDPYSTDQFHDDIMRLGENKPDEKLVRVVVDSSWDAVQWLARRVRVPFTLSFNRQAYLVDGRQKFWGGMALSVQDGGKGLIEAHRRALESEGLQTWFETKAIELLCEQDETGDIRGLIAERNGERIHIEASAVILATGGYEANPELREKFLGVPWAKAKVRGTPYNTGDGILLAQHVGAALAGDFSPSGCHSTCWDAHAPDTHGDRVLSNQFTKSGYPLGLMLNAHGERFVDEGADFRNYTYAKFGRAILGQPGGYVFQVWDSRGTEWLREEEYGDGIVRKVWADSIEELAGTLRKEGLENEERFVKTVHNYNDAVRAFQEANPTCTWDPSRKDGLSTLSLDIPKSNWALPLDEPPFLAVKVACGITFTFGGLAVDPETAGVLSERTGQPIPGLFCCGELVGGLFCGNYPGGSGLTAGAVLGRKAGAAAAKLVAKNVQGAEAS